MYVRIIQYRVLVCHPYDIGFCKQGMTRLVIEGLAKRFVRSYLFRDISWHLEGGQTLAVTGANGSGKSTFLQIVAGVMRATRGKVDLYIEDQQLSKEERPLSTGFVAPYMKMYDGLTARENLSFIGRVRQLPDTDERVNERLHRVGLGTRADDFVHTYSSGMKQRLKLAAATLMQPPLLLLDEPTTNLDTVGKNVVRHIIDEQVSRGGVLMLATNDAEEASWCDAVLSIEQFQKKRSKVSPRNVVGA